MHSPFPLHPRLTTFRSFPIPSTSTTTSSPSLRNTGGWRVKPTPLAQAMLEPERRIILAALQANGWNRQETARQLQINRTTLYKEMRQLGIDGPQ